MSTELGTVPRPSGRTSADRQQQLITPFARVSARVRLDATTYGRSVVAWTPAWRSRSARNAISVSVPVWVPVRTRCAMAFARIKSSPSSARITLMITTALDDGSQSCSRAGPCSDSSCSRRSPGTSDRPQAITYMPQAAQFRAMSQRTSPSTRPSPPSHSATAPQSSHSDGYLADSPTAIAPPPNRLPVRRSRPEAKRHRTSCHSRATHEGAERGTTGITGRNRRSTLAGSLAPHAGPAAAALLGDLLHGGPGAAGAQHGHLQEAATAGVRHAVGVGEDPAAAGHVDLAQERAGVGGVAEGAQSRGRSPRATAARRRAAQAATASRPVV